MVGEEEKYRRIAFYEQAIGFVGRPAESCSASRSVSWYTRWAVKDVGFMVTEAPPSTRERLFYCGGAPKRKAGPLWPKER